jgi:hypothetical protein
MDLFIIARLDDERVVTRSSTRSIRPSVGARRPRWATCDGQAARRCTAR